MKIIYNWEAQNFEGNTTEVATLPTSKTVLPDGTVFTARDGSTFLDIDTSDVYIFISGEWKVL